MNLSTFSQGNLLPKSDSPYPVRKGYAQSEFYNSSMLLASEEMPDTVFTTCRGQISDAAAKETTWGYIQLHSEIATSQNFNGDIK